MRALGDSGISRDVRSTEIDRHVQNIARFIELADPGHHSADRRLITLIARSAASDAAQALIGMKDELLQAGLKVKAIVARLEPEAELKQLFVCLSDLDPASPSRELIRWARNPRLLDAHEQVTYGERMCWSGDAMRRDAGKRNALALFADAAPDVARLGRLAFEALWGASTVVPASRLMGLGGRPSGGYEPSAPITQRPNLQAWPLIRH
jgi:hypothetical protein